MLVKMTVEAFVFEPPLEQDTMNFHQRATIATAMKLNGYADWRPPFDVPDLKRPPRRPESLEGEGRSAAVLVLNYLKDDSLHVVLTRRREDLAHHPGQISLPGGAQDDDESLDETAVRETVEEIGINGDRVLLLGQLNPVYIPPSDFTVFPYVGWYDGEPDFHPSAEEVGELIEADVQTLIDPETLKTGEIELDSVSTNNRRQVVPYFELGANHVWGATAIILGEFVDRVRNVNRKA